MTNYTGNHIPDGDDGRHPQSPYYCGCEDCEDCETQEIPEPESLRVCIKCKYPFWEKGVEEVCGNCK